MFKISCNFCPGWSLEWYFQYQPVKYKLTGNLTNIFKMTNNVETFLLFSENSFWFFGRKKRSIYIYKASKCFVRNRIFSISARSSLTAVQYSVLMIERGGILSLNLDLANVLVLEYWKQRRNTTSNIILRRDGGGRR